MIIIGSHNRTRFVNITSLYGLESLALDCSTRLKLNFRRSSIASIKMKIGRNCMPSSPFQRFWKSILKFKDSMKAIMVNRNFFLLLVSYGFINGTFYAFIILAGIWFIISKSSVELDFSVGIRFTQMCLQSTSLRVRSYQLVGGRIINDIITLWLLSSGVT